MVWFPVIHGSGSSSYCLHKLILLLNLDKGTLSWKKEFFALLRNSCVWNGLSSHICLKGCNHSICWQMLSAQASLGSDFTLFSNFKFWWSFLKGLCHDLIMVAETSKWFACPFDGFYYLALFWQLMVSHQYPHVGRGTLLKPHSRVVMDYMCMAICLLIFVVSFLSVK